MRKGGLKGIIKVFNFTLMQFFKNKSNNIMMIVMFLIAALIVPIASVFLGESISGTGNPTEIYSYISSVEEYIANGPNDYDTRYGVQYGYSTLLMMLSIFASSYIMRAIIEEKSSKLVETLMVSIRSEAMIFGKIIAVMVYMLIFVFGMGAVFAVSVAVTGVFRDTSFINDVLENMGISMSLLNLGPEIILVVLVSMILAFLIFIQLSALMASGCSNMEDAGAANSVGMMTILLGYMTSIITGSIGGSGVTILTSLIPVFSAFSAPVNFVLGDIGWGILLASWVLELICLLVIFKVSGKVYDSLIIYKGKRLKASEILAMAGKGAK